MRRVYATPRGIEPDEEEEDPCHEEAGPGGVVVTEISTAAAALAKLKARLGDAPLRLRMPGLAAADPFPETPEPVASQSVEEG